MRRGSLLGVRHDDAISSMMDVFFVILVVTIAIVGTWVFSLSGEGRYSVQLDEYNLHFASLSLERWLETTMPEVTVVGSTGEDVGLSDQKVIEALGIELVLLRQDVPSARFDELEMAIGSQLNELMLPDHHYAASAAETDSPGDRASGKGPISAFFFVSSEPAGDLTSFSDALKGHETYTSSYSYTVPAGLGGPGAKGPLQMTVDLACWVG